MSDTTPSNTSHDCIIVGGGAVGFFAAIHCAEMGLRVALLEQSNKPLSKLKISGGGRCNVTHHCFDPRTLVKSYPRGHKELLGPFMTFQPQDTVEWFESRGVSLKVEDDGRMFPTTDSSQTIIDCFMQAVKDSHVDLRLQSKVQRIEKLDGGEYSVQLRNEEVLTAPKLMLATGSGAAGHAFAEALGHTICPPIPSLFTFNIPTSPLLENAGIAVQEATVSLPALKLTQTGPVLLTHWGFSGPAVLKLSAWGAKELHACDYQTPCRIDWCPQWSYDDLRLLLERQSSHKWISKSCPLDHLPKQLWTALCLQAEVPLEKKWMGHSKKLREKLLQQLKADTYSIDGKTTFKQEFVTCGGVDTTEVRFKTMESKCSPGLYFGGEILNIDGITGGFNFQAAWTTAYLASQAMLS